MATNVCLLPLHIGLYPLVVDRFKKAWGNLLRSTEFVAQSPEYKEKFVFFDRFCFDFVSLLGDNLFKLSYKT